MPILPIEEVETAYYLRIQVQDKIGVMAKIAGILANAGISIEAIQQKEPAEDATTLSLVMLTHRVIEKQMNEAIREIESLDSVVGAVMRIRVEQLSK